MQQRDLHEILLLSRPPSHICIRVPCRILQVSELFFGHTSSEGEDYEGSRGRKQLEREVSQGKGGRRGRKMREMGGHETLHVDGVCMEVKNNLKKIHIASYLQRAQVAGNAKAGSKGTEREEHMCMRLA